MDHPHPHIGSSMSFAAAGIALIGAFTFDATGATAPVKMLAAAPAAVSFDDVKWGISLAVSCVFGAIGIYQHVVERIEKGRYKRQAMETQARLDREEMEADSRRRRELREAETKATIDRIAAEVRRHAGEPIDVTPPCDSAPAPPAATGTP